MDGYLFHHSVNVAVLAGVLGISKGYNQSQLADLGVGALLFDIGMTRLPKELCNHNGVLSEGDRKRMQQHTEDGFNLLRTQHDVSLLSAHCALQHHERYDGTGYPRGLAQNDIHEYAQIVAICDVYDALTSPRMHRKRYTPSEAIEFLFAAGNQYFSLDLIRLFCRHISIYPIATTLELNTGQVGVVSSVNPNAVQRPTVRILQEADGSLVKSPYEIDLNKDYHYVITRST
jgi:HD-GYP domain-containing protein (c-di-GMP phosphodiesterase class II)